VKILVNDLRKKKMADARQAGFFSVRGTCFVILAWKENHA
jgi:hypothetical protein